MTANAVKLITNARPALLLSFAIAKRTRIRHSCDLQYGDFVHSFGDVHLYNNHVEQAQLQLSRTPFPLPTMKINPAVKDIFAFEFGDFTLEHYQSHPSIKAPVAV